MQLVSRFEEERTGYGAQHTSPFGIGGAIAVHTVVIGAFLLMPKEVIDKYIPTKLITYAVPPEKAPPPEQTKTVEKKQLLPPKLSIQKPYIPPVHVDFGKTATIDGGTKIDPGTLGGTGMGEVTKPADPVPVLIDPAIDPRYARDFQPDYPPSMQRQEKEGKVTVRLRIGTDGRVIAVEKLVATDDAFWQVTQAQALRKWRFRPATRDGVAVEGVRIMTVHFRLDGQ